MFAAAAIGRALCGEVVRVEEVGTARYWMMEGVSSFIDVVRKGHRPAWRRWPRGQRWWLLLLLRLPDLMPALGGLLVDIPVVCWRREPAAVAATSPVSWMLLFLAAVTWFSAARVGFRWSKTTLL